MAPVVKVLWNGVLRRLPRSDSEETVLTLEEVMLAGKNAHGIPNALPLKVSLFGEEHMVLRSDSDLQAVLPETGSVKFVLANDDVDTDAFEVVTTSEVVPRPESPASTTSTELQLFTDSEHSSEAQSEAESEAESDVQSENSSETDSVSTTSYDGSENNLTYSEISDDNYLVDSTTSDAFSAAPYEALPTEVPNTAESTSAEVQETPSDTQETPNEVQDSNEITANDLKVNEVEATPEQPVPGDVPQTLDEAPSESPNTIEDNTSNAIHEPSTKQSTPQTFEQFANEVQPLIDALLTKLESRPQFIPALLERFGSTLEGRNWGVTVANEDGSVLASTSQPAPPAKQEISTPPPSVESTSTGTSHSARQEAGFAHRWRGVICDGCEVYHWTGPRYKCAQCPDFGMSEGAAGGIGQPLSLLVKSNPLVTELALYDIANTAGVAADLSHINTPAKVTGYRGDEQLAEALKGCHLVIIPAGIPRKPGMTRDDLFNINAGIVKGLATAAAKNCPTAFIAVISNPVNSTVPIVSEVFKQHGVYDPKRIFGVTTLDIVRANTFVGALKGTDPQTTSVTVIGGHSGVTIIPVLTSTTHSFTDEERDTLTHRVQYGGDEVVKAKEGAGSATLSMAYAGARFANSVLEASVLKKSGVKECTFVKSDVASGLEYFSTVVELGPEGVAKIHPVPSLSDYEKKLYDAAIPELKANIQKGIDFVKS
ncbi:hypothetical protein HDV00_006287 [Rhizophlyctis rosea]|nr:hypothetical protein HDV00_006287 [Rhizophlyctis rosea]